MSNRRCHFCYLLQKFKINLQISQFDFILALNVIFSEWHVNEKAHCDTALFLFSIDVVLMLISVHRYGLEPQVAGGFLQGVLRDAPAVLIHHEGERHWGGRPQPPGGVGAPAEVPRRATKIHGRRAVERQMSATKVSFERLEFRRTVGWERIVNKCPLSKCLLR